MPGAIRGGEGRVDHRLVPARELQRAVERRRTPDRGAERFFATVREQTRGPVWALLDEGGTLAARGIERAGRLRQWELAGARAGLEYVLEIDLDDPRHPGTRELVELVGQGVAEE